LFATDFKADVAAGFSRELDAALRKLRRNTGKGALRGAGKSASASTKLLN
jgi:hypothetical protein